MIEQVFVEKKKMNTAYNSHDDHYLKRNAKSVSS